MSAEGHEGGDAHTFHLLLQRTPSTPLTIFSKKTKPWTRSTGHVTHSHLTHLTHTPRTHISHSHLTLTSHTHTSH